MASQKWHAATGRWTHVRSESPRGDPLCGPAGCREDSSTLTFRCPWVLRRRGINCQERAALLERHSKQIVFEQSRQHRPLGPLFKRCEPTQPLAVLLMRARRLEHSAAVVARTPENVAHRCYNARPNRVPNVGADTRPPSRLWSYCGQAALLTVYASSRHTDSYENHFRHR